MPRIADLIEDASPLAPETLGRAVAERFRDSLASDLLAVSDAGRPMGAIVRGALRPGDELRTAASLATPAPVIDALASLDDACALVQACDGPCAGLIVVEDGLCRGVVSARSLLRRRGAMAWTENNQRFIELASHEVRTPVNDVLALAELLQRQALPPDCQAHVRSIADAGHAALRALSDAVELTQADTGELELEPRDTSLRDLMDQVQAAWQARAAQDSVTLLVSYDGDPHLNADVDAARVKQVFDKLIETSLNLSRRGVLEASLRAERCADGRLKITGRLRDSGGGLSAARLAPLFDDGGGEALAGQAGLGLMLCRRIVERMGGALHYDSNLGAGGTVAFEFMACEAQPAAMTADEAMTSSRAAHVLVVDDNATNRTVAEALCEMFDCTSECVEDGVEAVEAARSGRFDLILMDIRMPRMDGVEATRAIRLLPGEAGTVPIIALTANVDPADAETYLSCGMHEVVEKPIKPERLLAAINTVLAASSPRAAAAAA